MQERGNQMIQVKAEAVGNQHDEEECPRTAQGQRAAADDAFDRG